MGNEQNDENSQEDKKTFLSKHQKRLIKHQENKIEKVQETTHGKPKKKGKGKLFYIVLLLAIVSAWQFFSGNQNPAPNTTVLPAITKPLVGDHWHAEYSIYLCGQKRENFPESINLGLHTHGDGLIHVHPGKQDETGANANLGRFFDSLAQKFSDKEILDKKSGDICPNTGKAGSVKLLANGKENPQFRSYVPQDGDKVEIRFE